MTSKDQLRRELRLERKAHVTGLPDAVRGLLFRHPPAPLAPLIARQAVIGLYKAMPTEAPARHYASHFADLGHPIALPWFADRHAPMQFRAHVDPLGETDLEVGPFGILQPFADAPELVPDVLFVPLLAFTDRGMRIGQGGGHYDRWLGAYRHARAIGLAWDCQLRPELPVEPHDIPLSAVVTPTRLYGPF